MTRTKPAPTINTNVPRNITSEGGLYGHLLDNNRGLGFAIDHSSIKAIEAITKNAPNFKSKGVDTAYVEFSKDTIGIYNAQSLQELKKARSGLARIEKDNPEMYQQYSAAMEEQSQSFYEGQVSAKQLMNMNIALYDMAIALRENNINLKSFENTETEMLAQKNRGMDQRVKENNRDWVNFIENDRAQIDPHGKGKFITLAGSIHYNNTVEGNGTVSKDLGIPTVAHTHSTLPGFMHLKHFYKGDNPNGSDFYIPSGPNHADLKQFVLPKETPRETTSNQPAISNKPVADAKELANQPEVASIATNLKKTKLSEPESNPALAQNSPPAASITQTHERGLV